MLLTGCAGAHLQDKEKLETANAAKETYAAAKVDTVILEEKTNLQKQLAEELKIVRANYQLRLDYAFLRMAADDNRPMADSRVTRAADRLTSLGFVGDKKPNADGDKLNQIQKLRAYLIQEASIRLKQRELKTRSDLIFGAYGSRPPECSIDLPDALPPRDTLTPNQRVVVRINYKQYRKICAEALGERTDLIDKDGEIQTAYAEWQQALREHEKLENAIEDLSAEVADAKTAHEGAARAAGAEGAETEAKMQETADKLRTVLDKAGGKVESLGVLPKERIKALSTILLAIASKGEDDEIEGENLGTATVVAGQIPTIAGQIAALREDGEAPSVSALLIELRHQSILLDYATEQQKLVKDRADLHEKQYKAYKDEARQWLNFHDALCSYAVRMAGGPHPGRDCNKFVVTLAKKNGGNTAICALPGRLTRGECALGKSWKATLASPPADKNAKRELYKALAAFSLAMAARAPQDEYDYQLVDLDHQEVVAANESAIKAWDSLVKVPIDQVAAYHAAGIPPEKIAELLVTGLSLGSIAAGVNR